MPNRYTFTSESVSEGHPDKMADQISDAILDSLIARDKNSRVACETLVKTINSGTELTHHAIIAGEISTTVENPDYEATVRETIKQIGYDNDTWGYDSKAVQITNLLNEQSPDIAQGVDAGKDQKKEQGAGDQGLMFGYACNETDVLMPLPITYAHRLMARQAEIRKSGKLSWLGPDAKAQVSVDYEDDKPVAISKIVVSTQHDESAGSSMLREAVIEEIIKPVVKGSWMPSSDNIMINPTGKFTEGGPKADCGLTGRKIIVDTYGGMARHGGGAFSGKDPSKVDRSAAYAARHVAKNLVAAGLVERCEIQIAYAIGVAEPVSMMVNSFGTAGPGLDDEALARVVSRVFDLRPERIISDLDLLRPIYSRTAAYGHFGRTEDSFSWENTGKAEDLANAAVLDTRK